MIPADDPAAYEWPQARAFVLERMAAEVEQINRDHGWYDDDRTFGDDCALLHSEVSEALEAYRVHGLADATATLPVTPCDDFTCCSLPKPEGVGSELADVLIRLLDTANRRGVNLAAEYERKTTYNRSRPYRHGGKAL